MRENLGGFAALFPSPARSACGIVFFSSSLAACEKYLQSIFDYRDLNHSDIRSSGLFSLVPIYLWTFVTTGGRNTLSEKTCRQFNQKILFSCSGNMILKNDKIFPDSERNKNFKKCWSGIFRPDQPNFISHGRNVNIKKGYITLKGSQGG